MNRVNPNDTRDLVYNEDVNVIDPESLTTADVNRLLLAIALRIGAVNPRCLLSPEYDSTLSDDARANLMLSMYNKMWDEETGTWVDAGG